MQNFQRLVKKNVEFSGLTRKKYWNFQWTWSLVLKFSRYIANTTLHYRNSRNEALFCPGPDIYIYIYIYIYQVPRRRRGRGAWGPCHLFFCNNILPGMLSGKFAFVSLSKASETFLVLALPEFCREPVCCMEKQL